MLAREPATPVVHLGTQHQAVVVQSSAIQPAGAQLPPHWQQGAARLADEPFFSIEQFEDFKTLKGYRFTTRGQLHQVMVAHHNCKWLLDVDGRIVGERAHSIGGLFKSNEFYSIEFAVQSPDGRAIPGALEMTWKGSVLRGFKWHYALIVNGRPIPEFWDRRQGQRETQIPEVAMYE